MNEPDSPELASNSRSSQDMASALFAQLILQQTNMAMMLLGKIAHPESGQIYKDVEAARLFIDQLEMLETKTKGNLTKEESGLLKQSLMNLRLAFVEVVESPQGEGAAQPASQPATAKPTESSAEVPASAAEDEHRKKFSKKY
jgi:hypothetical protein